MNTQKKIAAVAVLLLSSSLFSMDVDGDADGGKRPAAAQPVEAAVPAKLTFAQQMAAKKAAALRAADDGAAEARAREEERAREEAARLVAHADALEQARREAARDAVAGRKTLEEFAADAVDGKVGDHFVIPHAGRAILDTATHKAILAGHESFDPTAGTHMTKVDAEALIQVEKNAKVQALATARHNQDLIDIVKSDFAGEIAGAMEPILAGLCAALKVDTDEEATDDAALVGRLVAADAGSDALVTKFLAAHGGFAQDSAEATKIKRLVDLIKFFNA